MLKRLLIRSYHAPRSNNQKQGLKGSSADHPLLKSLISLSLNSPYLKTQNMHKKQNPNVLSAMKEQELFVFDKVLDKIEEKDDKLLNDLISKTFVANSTVPELRIMDNRMYRRLNKQIQEIYVPQMTSNDHLAKPILNYLVGMSKENIIKSFVLEKRNQVRGTSESNRLVLNDTEQKEQYKQFLSQQILQINSLNTKDIDFHSLSNKELVNLVQEMIQGYRFEFDLLFDIENHYTQQQKGKATNQRISRIQSQKDEIINTGILFKTRKEIQKRMYSKDKGLSTQDFIKLLRIQKEVYNVQEWGVLARLRFFKHYDLEVIHFLRTKMIPEMSFRDMNLLLNFYAYNRKELGERFNNSELFEDMVCRVKDTIQKEIENAKEYQDYALIAETLNTNSILLIKNKDTEFIMDIVGKVFFDKMKKHCAKSPKSKHSQDLVFFYMSYIFCLGNLDLVKSQQKMIHEGLKLCIPVIKGIMMNSDRHKHSYIARVYETVKQLSMSDSFDNPLVEFLVQDPKFTNGYLANNRALSQKQYEKLCLLLQSIEQNFQRRENSDKIPSFFDMIQLQPNHLKQIKSFFQTYHQKVTRHSDSYKLNGQIRYFIWRLVNSTLVQKTDIYNEVSMKELPYRGDIGILPKKEREGYKALSWPYKGILLEFDGPHHYYAPSIDGKFEPTRFTKNRVEMIKSLEGFKVFTVPFYMNEMPEEGNVFDTFDSQAQFESQSFDLRSLEEKLRREIYAEYLKMKEAYGE